MFCENCGNKMAENERFCANCGTMQKSASNPVNSAPSTLIPNPSRSNTYAAPASGNKLYDLLMGIALILMIIGTFVPCYTVSLLGYSQSLSYIEGDGKFIVAAAVIALVLYVINRDKLILIPSAIAALILAIFTSEASNIGVGSFGIGYYLMWIGTVVAIILPFTPILKTKGLFVRNKK